MRLLPIAYLVACGLVFSVVFLLRYNGIDPGLYQVRDDGVITMSVGRHLVDFGFIGVSPSGPIVEASSSPLQTFTYAAIYALFGLSYDSYALYQTIIATFCLGSAFAVIFTGSRVEGIVTIALLSLGLSAIYPFFLWHGSGMENALTHVLLVLSIAGLAHMLRVGRVSYLWAIPLVLTCFTRLELLPTVLALLILFAIFWHALFHQTKGYGLALLVLAICVAVHALRYSYFGELFPNTAAAQGISPFDRLSALLSGSLVPVNEAYPISFSNFFKSGWWLAIVSLPLAILLPKSRDALFLILAILTVIIIAMVSPVVLGPPRIDWGRTYSHVAPVALLLPAWCLFEALKSRQVLTSGLSILIVAVAGNWMLKNEPYYLGWAVDDFDEIRREFKDLADANTIDRALVANPDLGVMSWHKDFNILDLGMLGSPVMSSIHNEPAVADYVLDFARPDLIESHGFWTRKYCQGLFLDPRFQERYRPVASQVTPEGWCADPEPEKTIWIRRSIEIGFDGDERRFLDSLQTRLTPDVIAAEIDACKSSNTDCSYIMRSVFRFIPELSAQGRFQETLALFSDAVERAYLSGWRDSSATKRIAQHLRTRSAE